MPSFNIFRARKSLCSTALSESDIEAAIMTAFVIYGATVFAERRFWEELLCTVAFKDYGSAYNTGFFAYTFDTLMLSLGLAFLCGGLSLLLEKIHRKEKKTNETSA